MTGTLPRFDTGMAWKDVSAHQMNTLVAEVERLRTITGGTGVNVNTTPHGVSITATTKPPTNVRRELIVAVIEEPTEESETLFVRQIRYATMPPTVGDFEWDSNHFEAHPAHGFKPLDYKSYYCNPSETTPPSDKAFLRVERRQGVWILHPPPRAALGNAVVIRAIPEGDEYGTVLQVQRIMLTDGGQWSATGETIEMPTFPLTPAIFWTKFITPEGSIPQFVGDVQPTVTIDGVECVGLFVPFFPVTVRSDEPHRGPRPV